MVEKQQDSLRVVLEQVNAGIKREVGNVVDEDMLAPMNRSAIDSADYRMHALLDIKAILEKKMKVADYIEVNGGYASVQDISVRKELGLAIQKRKSYGMKGMSVR